MKTWFIHDNCRTRHLTERLAEECAAEKARKTVVRCDDQSNNGVRVWVYRDTNGTSVDADCSCFGNPARVHSTTGCPVLKGC